MSCSFNMNRRTAQRMVGILIEYTSTKVNVILSLATAVRKKKDQNRDAYSKINAFGIDRIK